MTQEPRDAAQFYLTSPTPCPYLPGQTERKVFTHLIGRRAIALNDRLTQNGFRRSQTIAYRPACETCRACVSVRICVDDFAPGRSFRKVLARNADIQGRMLPALPVMEHYSVFRAYLDARHDDGGMADMTVLDYAMMIEDSHVESRLVEYRMAGRGGAQGALVAVCLTDILEDGLSMVYSFYEPEEAHRSLGTFMVLDHIARTRQLGLPNLYLGYWIKDSRKMAYKERFLPQERLGMQGWERVG